MNDPLPKTYLTRQMVPAVLERLRTICDVHINPEDRTMPHSDLLREMETTEILVPNGPDAINAELIEASPKLKLIASFGVGYNHIDVETATRRGIPVTNTPGILSECTADIAWGLLMNVARRIGEGDRMIRANAWPGWGPLQLLGGDVTGATLGLIGLGNIGKAMIPRAKGFSMKVMYWNRTRLDSSEEDALGIRYADRDTILAEADFVSLHVALVPETRHLITARELSLMKPTAYLINTTRGPVVDESALVAALEKGQIAGAGLDVYEKEPEVHPGLLPLENVVLAPHLGSATVGRRTKMGMLVADNVEAHLKGNPLPYCVNPEVYS
ncbi:MAG: D-glycerate dehydrogenase [Verrucomicrobiae bacterium]|nr:D-glycerate dehydrogenase [Verrucomicrobiae bacterium]